MKKQDGPIGIFDSGVGGLSVLREIRSQLPGENLIYIADQAHVPYGEKSRGEVLAYSQGIIRFLLRMGVKLIVIACNTASAVALTQLREIYPAIPFVGMEPAVKPAAAETNTGVVGVLATPATFQGDLYASTVDRFAKGVKILQDTCPGLVPEIEDGRIDGKQARKILSNALVPMMEAGVDEVVLGCTHYPFVIPLIRDIVGDQITVIDPAPAVARQVGRLIREFDLANTDQAPGKSQFYTTGDPEDFSTMLQNLLGLNQPAAGLKWVESDLRMAEDQSP